MSECFLLMYCQCLSSEQTSNYVPLTLFKKQQMIETRPRHYCNSCTSPNRRSSWVHWGDTFTHSWSRQSGQVETIKDKYWEAILLLMRRLCNISPHKTFLPETFLPETFLPTTFPPIWHFTPHDISPHYISPQSRFTPKTFHPVTFLLAKIKKLHFS